MSENMNETMNENEGVTVTLTMTRHWSVPS